MPESPVVPAVARPPTPPPGGNGAVDHSLPGPGQPNGTTPAPTALARAFVHGGEPRLISGLHPLLLDDPDAVWFIAEGSVELFATQVRDGEPSGARAHFLSLTDGQLLFGMDQARYGQGYGFLGVGPIGTKLFRLSLARFQALAADLATEEAVAVALDAWLVGLSAGLTKDIAVRPKADLLLAEEGAATLAPGTNARAKQGIVWAQVLAGETLFIGLEDLLLAGEQIFFPLSPETWVEALDETRLNALFTLPMLDRPELWQGLALFHETLCRCEFLNKKLVAVDEFNRLKGKAEYQRAAKEAALRDIVSVMARRDRPAGADDAIIPTVGADAGDRLLAACQLVGEALGITVRPHPEAKSGQTGAADPLLTIAKASRFRLRQVGLRDDWYQQDQGPLLAYDAETKAAFALLPEGPRAYALVDPTSRERRRVTPEAAATLAPFAQSFYRPFPNRALKATDLLRFGARGLRSDLVMIGFLAVAMGLLGMLTPYFSGPIFDTVIPGAERGQLVQLTLGLFFAALATAAFHVTRSIAVLRIEGKMDFSVQAGLWDRLLDLPSTFFRDYSAGDLASRAAGIDRMRSTISGAGVSAILGSLTSVAYFFMLFQYSLQLAMIGLALTLVAVLFTTLANFLQLRHQRHQFTLEGKIVGLVLQLITGISKLRTAGAEDHAFRVWAKAFSEQKRIGFKVGRITNFSEVFTSGFPVLASLCLFATLVAAQNAAAKSGARMAFSTGDFIAFNVAFAMFLNATLSLSNASLNLLSIVPIYERLRPIITTPAEVQEDRTYPGQLKGEIELYHVHFRYTPEGPLIIKDISLHIKPGEFVAFVGGSGCGKSTLLRLLLGFETPESGKVYYDGQDLARLDLREVRQQIGVVLQSSKLTPTDIYHNIIGAFNLTVDDAWVAARMAGIGDDIHAMPMGMHTVVSEGGGAFSGGQKQRLMIARAIVNRPRILFFDEATSALDNATQRTVSQSLDGMQATRIVIAHRLSTVVNADRIVVFDKGQIVQIGPYHELIAQEDGLFAELARRQHT